jgi:hypothetical protein
MEIGWKIILSSKDAIVSAMKRATEVAFINNP